MSIKSQLNSTRDFLMVGIRRLLRFNAETQAEKVFRRPDMVETLGRRPTEIDLTEVEMTLSVMHKADGADDEPPDAGCRFVDAESHRPAAGGGSSRDLSARIALSSEHQRRPSNAGVKYRLTAMRPWLRHRDPVQ
jgi:hypothetical protein